MSSHSSYKKVDDQLTSSSNPQKLSNYPIISQPPETLHINSEYLPTSTYPSPESTYEYPSHYLNSHYPEQNSDPTFPGKDIDRRALSFILHLRSFASACLPSTLAYHGNTSIQFLNLSSRELIIAEIQIHILQDENVLIDNITIDVCMYIYVYIHT